MAVGKPSTTLETEQPMKATTTTSQVTEKISPSIGHGQSGNLGNHIIVHCNVLLNT